MASHAAFPAANAANAANAKVIRNLVDIVKELAGAHDLSYSVNYMNRNEMIPHFTRWRSMSVEQKARVLDLILETYDASLCNPVTNISAPVDESFIKCSDLRKQSHNFSSQLMEGMMTLREKSEDVLGIYFLLNVDALGAFGQSSRDLAKYIHYRVPLIYRNDAALHEHCRLFANALASVVLHRANQTPFRRSYTEQFKNKYQPFILQPGAELPYLVPAIDIPYSPIQPLLDDERTLAPTVPNSPGPSTRNLAPQDDDPYTDTSGIDFSSEEVQRALDRAERAAGCRVVYPGGALPSVIEEGDFGSGSERGSGSIGSTSTPSVVSTTIEFGNSVQTHHRVSGAPANPTHPTIAAEGSTHAREDSAMHTVFQSLSQPMRFTVSPGYVVITAPGSPATPTRRGRPSATGRSSSRGSTSSASIPASPASTLPALHHRPHHQGTNAAIRARRTPSRETREEQHFPPRNNSRA